jgi:FemAB-related protein (PEP-CTERM system-associated)
VRAAESVSRRYPVLSSGGTAARNRHAGESPVQVGIWTDGAAWDAFILRATDGTMAHRWAWLGIVSETYGHKVIPLAATRAGELAGVLPLVEMRSRLFGRHLVSMPFLDTGGLCTDGDQEADQALVSAAIGLAEAHGLHLELRHRADRSIPLVPSLRKVTMVVDLSGGENALWKKVDGNRRTQVRKARKAGLTASVHGSEALADFYRILAANLRDLGSPVHRQEFFRRLMDAFGEDARIVLAGRDGRIVGAALILFQGDWAGMPWSGSLRSFFRIAPSQLVYWQALCHGIDRGCRVFDLGRSSPNSGTYGYKREWSAEPVQLFWHRLPGDDSDGDTQRWQWGTEVWRHLPVPVASMIGAAMRGGLPQ